jgi:hypothetical protein
VGAAGTIEFIIDPRLRDWSPPPTPIPERSRRFRRELGLPTDRPIVMTGHQPGLWHAGILAKFLAARALADRTGSAAAWCVPDMDDAEPGSVRVPAAGSTPGAPGRWTARTVELVRWARPVAGVALASRPPGEVAGDAPPALAPFTGRLRARAGEADAARQAQRAAEDLLADCLALRGDAPTHYASHLPRTSFFREIIGRMRADPHACVRSYNRAVRARAAARELETGADAGRAELPLWRLEAGEPRRIVRAGELAAIDTARLAPRALLFTGLLRLAACDLYIHGTGGAEYDGAGEAWLNDWLGETMAPAMVVSATVLLDLGVPRVSPADLARAVWRAHHARHNPALLGDGAAGDAKRALLERLARADAPARPALFRELHDLLDDARRTHAPALSELDRGVESARAALADATLAQDRTWPWLLHPPAALEALGERIAATIAAR